MSEIVGARAFGRGGPGLVEQGNREDERGSLAGRLALVTVIQGVMGGAGWVFAVTALDPRAIRSFAGALSWVQVAALLGGGGLPVLVYRFGASGGRHLWRLSLLWGAVGTGALGAATSVAVGMPRSATPFLVGAAAAPVVDAWLVLGGRVRVVAARVVGSGLLRFVLLLCASRVDASWLPVVAGLAPEALSTLIVVAASRPVTSGHRSWPRLSITAGIYFSTVVLFGAVVLMPFVVVARANPSTAVVVAPAWAALSLGFAAVHSASNAAIAGDRRDGWVRVATIGAVVGGLVLVGLAQWPSEPGRWVEVAEATGLLMVASAPWPYVAGRLAGARRADLVAAPLTIVLPLLIGVAAIWWLRLGSTAGVAATWGAAMGASFAIAVLWRGHVVVPAAAPVRPGPGVVQLTVRRRSRPARQRARGGLSCG